MKNKGKYKVPKSYVLWPILWRTVIFVVVIVLIFAVLDLLAEYVKDFRSEADREYVNSVVSQYNEASESGRKQVLARLANDGHDYCIMDLDGNIVEQNGDITVSGFDPKKKVFDEKTYKELLEDVGVKDEEFIDLTAKVFSDDENRDQTFLVEDVDTSLEAFTNAANVVRNDSNFLKHYDNVVVTFPYWIGSPISSTSQILLVKTDLSVKVKDYTYLAGGMLIALLIAVIVFVIMIISVIRNLIATSKIKNQLFRDNITRNRNWFWYAASSQDILWKRRNANKTYAVVELVFVKYRNFVLCHSVREAEDLMRKVVAIIDRKLKPSELCAHSNSPALPLLLQVSDEQEARARLQDIINALVAIPSGNRLAFKAGVYMITPAQEKIALGQKRYIPDIDLLYNNACTAELSIETADSGIAFFDSKLVEEEKWIDTVIGRQIAAVQNGEFLIYYQPKYNPRTNELRGTEALIRWNAPDLGLVSPSKFIPIFEDNGFITVIDDYMLTHVARDQRKWLNEGRKCVPISVNVSRAHFGQSNLAEYICSIIDREGCPRNLLEIELTESAFFDDENAMIDTINRLKYYGFLVSMDDFGSGYSSLNSLKDMPLDILKLDAGFFRGSEDNPRTEIVVSEAIRLAKSLNMLTVAEGVEDKATVDFLANEGCDMIQGYYYAKPMPREEYETRVIPVIYQVAPAAQPVQQVPVQPVQQAPVQPVQQVQAVPAQQVQQAPVQQAQPDPVQQVQQATVQPAQTAPVQQPQPEPQAQPAAPNPEQ